jgi:dihydrofolate reductase
MRKLIALVFNYSVNGLLAAEGTDYYRFCFELLDQHGGATRDDETLGLLRNAHAHIMGRSAYEGMSRALPANPDHPWASIINAGRKVVFSRTLRTADWTNTTIATRDTADEVEMLRQGGDGHIIVWGGVTLWHSLMRLDLMDEFRISMYPYIADEGRRVFDDVPHGYRLDLLSSVGTRSGVVELRYGRHR